eukprot:gene3076-2058_t
MQNSESSKTRQILTTTLEVHAPITRVQTTHTNLINHITSITTATSIPQQSIGYQWFQHAKPYGKSTKHSIKTYETRKSSIITS